MGGFNQQSVDSNGGVAWVRQVADNMDYSGLDGQIQSYQQAASQLQKVQATLQNVKNNLAASWTGDAADQAQASFQGSIDQATQAHDTIQAVVQPLQSAKAAQVEFVNTVKGIQNEKTVPSNSVTDEASHFVFGTPLPSQVAQSHNTAVRTEAANALNKLSNSYEQSASDMHLAVSGGRTGGEGGAAYDPEVSGGGSGDGLAAGYSERVGGGQTVEAGFVPTPGGGNPGGTVGNPSPTGTASATLEPVPVPVGTPGEGEPFPIESEPELSPVGGGAELITDELGGTGGGESPVGNVLEEENRGINSKAGVFDEHGFSDGELTGGRGTGTKVRSMVGLDEEEGSAGSRGGVFGEEEVENPQSMSGMGGGRGRGGMGGEGEEELSSKYSRGRYFDGEMEEGERSSRSPVRSAFENATDGEGNKVDMMGGRRSSGAGEDEEEERGKRPKYLTEDEFWGNAQRVVPPVIQ